MSNNVEPKVLGNLPKGMIFVLSAPSGTGKTTLLKMLLKEFSCLEQSISYTTREPRAGEQEEKDYFFISKKKFLELKEKGAFLESAEVFDEYYGTSKSYVEERINQGKHVLLVIDTQGAMQLKKKLEAVFIFLAPPSMEELQKRLSSRGAETKDAQSKRLKKAEEELVCAKEYKYYVVNEELSVTYDILRAIFIAEEHSTQKQLNQG